MKKFGLKKYTIDCFFQKVIEKYGDLPSVANFGETPMTYRHFGERVRVLQNKLQELGVDKGDHVAIMGYSNVNWATAFMSIMTMGAVAVSILEEFPEADVNHILEHSDSIGLFISRSHFESMDLPVIKKLNFVISLDDFSVLKVSENNKNILNKVKELPELILKATKLKTFPEKKIPRPSNIEEEDLAEIVYTSGTTGHSKGVMLTHKNLVSNLFEGPDLLGVINENSVVLHFLPMAHTFGSTSGFLSIIYKGSTIYFLGKKPVPKILMTAMQEVRPTIIGAVPLIFEKIFHKQVLPSITQKKVLQKLHQNKMGRRLLYKLIGKKIKKAFGGRLECAIIGGAKLSIEVEIFLKEAGIPFAVGYGLTECSPLVTFSSMEEAKLGSVGHPITDVQVKIANPDPEIGIGEILIKGPNVMKGYYKNEKMTREVITEDGWFVSGDRGYLDENNFLYITGRSKNVIIGPSGENIYAETIEEKIKEYLFVEEVIVHELEGKIVARIYPDFNMLNEMVESDVEEEIAHHLKTLSEKMRKEVNEQLPPFSRISKVIIHNEPFSKTPTNKIRRFEYY